MEAQAKYAQVSQALALLVLTAALALGVLGGYALRGVAAESTRVETSSDSTRIVPVPRSVREGIEITPYQAPAPRWTHEDNPPAK